MAAIRNAGGKGKVKLKSAKDRKIERKKEKEEQAVSASSGGDLMGDLFAKLTMRRKGISGTKKPEAGGGSSEPPMSPMDKISSMIPAPTKTNRAESVDSNSSDWD